MLSWSLALQQNENCVDAITALDDNYSSSSYDDGADTSVSIAVSSSDDELTPQTPGTMTTQRQSKEVSPIDPTKKRLRRRRPRMSVEERRVRHREAQRKFMKTKRARVLQLRLIIRGLERQTQFVMAMRECDELRRENEQLREMWRLRSQLFSTDDLQFRSVDLPVSSTCSALLEEDDESADLDVTELSESHHLMCAVDEE
ncbi:hypothetical protein PINS_up011920 [Pythium insidiosum]|nr:hypothetical protein PINS_up011920 [Pythium insidiosum]